MSLQEPHKVIFVLSILIVSVIFFYQEKYSYSFYGNSIKIFSRVIFFAWILMISKSTIVHRLGGIQSRNAQYMYMGGIHRL